MPHGEHQQAMTSLAHLVIVFTQTRRAVVMTFASVCLAAGCSYAPSVDGGPAAAAAAESSEATTVSESTAATMPEPPSLPTLGELLAEERFVPLAIALERSGLDDVIDGLDDFVLLAPTETAFASAGTDLGVDYLTLVSRPQLLEAVMRYHVVADPSADESWRTLNGAVLDASGSDPGTIDGVEVLDRIPVRNGIVLVMPRLVLPASQPFGTQPPGDD